MNFAATSFTTSSPALSWRNPHILAFAALILWLPPLFAVSLLPFTEQFNYSAGNLGSVGSGGVPAWAGSTTANVIADGNLDGTGFGLPASIGRKNSWSTTTASSTFATFATVSGDIPNTAGTAVYLSFLISVTDATSVSTAGENVMAVTLQNGGSTHLIEIWLKNVSGAVQIGVAKLGGTPSYASTNILNTTSLIVANYAYVSGTANDLVNLWVNPSAGGAEPVATVTAGNGAADNISTTGMGRLYFFGGVMADVDSVRMGLNWSDVTPATAGATAPAISTPPANQSVGVHQSANFSVTASGTAPLFYQWYFNTNTALASNTNSTFTLANIQRTNAGNYSVVVSNTSGAVTSSYAVLTVTNTPPAAVNNTFSRPRYLPLTILKSDLIANDTDPDGDALTLSGTSLATTNGIALATNATQIFYTNAANVTDSFTYTVSDGFGGSATGTTFITISSNPIAYWQSAVLTGTKNTLTYAGHVGYNYEIRRSLNLSNWTSIGFTAPTNSIFTVTDNFADLVFAPTNAFYRLVLALTTPPAIITPPASLTVTQNQNATFSVAASGTAPLAYQWFKGNAAIINATNATLTLNNVLPGDATNYSVIVTNSAGSATSGTATLTVLVPPSITTPPPSSLTVTQNQNATFTVVASGTMPLNYQWRKAGVNIGGATNTSLTLSNVTSSAAANYDAVVTNVAGSVTSSVAALTVLTPPSITAQPQSTAVTVGQNATFTVAAGGDLPLRYQWYFNTNTALASATNASLTITNAQTNNAGNYSATVTNAVGTATSAVATLTVNTASTNMATNLPDFGLYGFATADAGCTGGGVIATNNSAYVQVTNALGLANAIKSAASSAGSVKVIEIMNDLNLGWNEIDPAVTNLASTPFRAHNLPQLHPVLLNVGMSLLDIKPKSGLTIFSANGATIRHCNFNVKSCNNIIIRNLKFDENWEWDEATKGNYDKNDWDFITVGNGGNVSNLWIDHCTFTKSYDGIVDQKAGVSEVTFSWNKYVGDDGATNTNSWVRQQINALEANKSAYPFYNFLRTHGFSVEDIVQIIQAHDKTHLAGSLALDTNNASLAMTFHHQFINGVWDRCVPRLRGGNVHDYNIYVDDSNVLAAQRLRNTRAAAMSSADQSTLNNTYSIDPPINGAISTESGALLVEKSVYKDCLWPLRNNQTDPSNPAYTGKIMALDSIYHFDNADGSAVDYRGNSTNSPGNNYFGPLQAPVIAFSWNWTAGALPYTYTTDDPTNLLTIVSNYAGAGVLTWAKTNWLKTSY